MTDQQKIEKLAKWAGYYVIEHVIRDGEYVHTRISYEEKNGLHYTRAWNPPTNIADALILIKKMSAVKYRGGFSLRTRFQNALERRCNPPDRIDDNWIFNLTAENIFEAVLEVIK